jgi:hypothetical protein
MWISESMVRVVMSLIAVTTMPGPPRSRACRGVMPRNPTVTVLFGSFSEGSWFLVTLTVSWTSLPSRRTTMGTV